MTAPLALILGIAGARRDISKGPAIMAAVIGVFFSIPLFLILLSWFAQIGM